MKDQVLEQLNYIHDEFDVDTESIIEFVEEQSDSIAMLESKIDDLKEEKLALIETIQETESEVRFEYPAGYNRSIVSDLVLEKLFDNLSLIGLDKLEKFIDKQIS